MATVKLPRMKPAHQSETSHKADSLMPRVEINRVETARKAVAYVHSARINKARNLKALAMATGRLQKVAAQTGSLARMQHSHSRAVKMLKPASNAPSVSWLRMAATPCVCSVAGGT